MGEVKFHTFKKPFITESGFSISEPKVAYQTWGRLNEKRDNVILVCHALTGNTAADEWFGGLFGSDKILDPEQYFIICPNVLGSCYGTSGPASINPKTGKPYRADFPVVTIRDIVRQQQLLFDELQVTGIKAVIGGSMGGMQALEWCIMDNRPHAAVLIGMGKAHSPWAVGISHAQRQAIYNDPNWKAGYYSNEQQPVRGLATARMIAMNSYRSPDDFNFKFGRNYQAGSKRFQVESYLNYQGEKLAKRFDAASYVHLTEAMDSHDVRHSREGYSEVLGAVEIPIVVTGISSDQLYPTNEQKELAALLPAGVYREIDSPHGHDAFLIEFDQMNAIFNSFLNKTHKAKAI